jgi:hypothetical protein
MAHARGRPHDDDRDGIVASVVEHWLTMGPGGPILIQTTT